jgi:hypothetical protein
MPPCSSPQPYLCFLLYAFCFMLYLPRQVRHPWFQTYFRTFCPKTFPKGVLGGADFASMRAKCKKSSNVAICCEKTGTIGRRARSCREHADFSRRFWACDDVKCAFLTQNRRRGWAKKCISPVQTARAVLYPSVWAQKRPVKLSCLQTARPAPLKKPPRLNIQQKSAPVAVNFKGATARWPFRLPCFL